MAYGQGSGHWDLCGEAAAAWRAMKGRIALKFNSFSTKGADFLAGASKIRRLAAASICEEGTSWSRSPTSSARPA